MILRPIYTQGELTAFIPEINSTVTAGVSDHAPEAVAGRSDHLSPGGPAGTSLSVECQPDVTAGRTRQIFPVSNRGQRNGRRASIPFSALFHPQGAK